MNIGESAIMGAIQGLTEFLPVSSSGHLAIAQSLFGLTDPASNLWFTVALHLATVLSSIVVFRREIWAIVRGTLRFTFNDQSIYFLNIIISMLPIMLVGLLFKDQIEALFAGKLILVGAMLVVTAVLLTFSHFARAGVRPVTPKRAFVIGIAQAIAVLPGLSRSGATISAALLQGVRRDEAARFSFLMVIIPILGMSLLDVAHVIRGGAAAMPADGGGSAGGFAVVLAVGFVVAFLTGLFACRVMIKLVSRGKLIWFAAYCVLAGLTAITLGLLGL